ncbi:MAG TPA: AI-2E family transporter [Elusimicrobiota bacterium]|nr:AI-2E family transporter [Elusimicrobiota bacterium]
MDAKIFRTLIAFSVVLGALWFLYAARTIVLPFVLAGVLAYLLNPMITFFEMRGVRRDTAIIVLYLMVFGLTVALAYGAIIVLLEDIPKIYYNMPQYIEQARVVGLKMQGVISERWPWLSQFRLVDKIGSLMGGVIQKTMDLAPAYLYGVIHIVVYIVLIPFVTFFFLSEGRNALDRWIDRVPSRWVEKTLSLLCEVDETLGNYLRAILMDAAFVGILSMIGLGLLGVNYAVLIGAVAGFGNFIPYMGPLIGVSVGVIVAFFQFQNLWAPLQVVAVFAAVKFFDDWFLQPMVLKKSVDLHPVMVIFAVFCGGELAGFWGLFFAVPVVCILREIISMISMWSLSEVGFQAAPNDLMRASAKPWIV